MILVRNGLTYADVKARRSHTTKTWGSSEIGANPLSTFSRSRARGPPRGYGIEDPANTNIWRWSMGWSGLPRSRNPPRVCVEKKTAGRADAEPPGPALRPCKHTASLRGDRRFDNDRTCRVSPPTLGLPLRCMHRGVHLRATLSSETDALRHITSQAPKS